MRRYGIQIQQMEKGAGQRVELLWDHRFDADRVALFKVPVGIGPAT